MAGRLRRTGLVVGLVVMLLPMAAASSLGAKPANELSKSWQTGYSASSDSFVCTSEDDVETGCTTTHIRVFLGKGREQGSGAVAITEVCYIKTTAVFDEFGGESITEAFGCTADVPEGTNVRHNLRSAAIAPTSLMLNVITCDQDGDCVDTGTRAVTVSGTFTATGPRTRSTGRSFEDHGTCWTRESFRGKAREALFSGTLDGQPFESDPVDGSTEIQQGTFTISSTCPDEEE